jgi:hypothetical protein
MIVDGFEFTFPPAWSVHKYDEWAFYRKQFQKCAGGQKAVDIAALCDSTLWLIEVKDYRLHNRTKVIDIAEEVALKSRDSIAGIFAAAMNADNEEKDFARNCIQCNKIRIVLQLEQPVKQSKLFPRAIDPASVRQKLRQLLKPIDAHPLVVERSSGFNQTPWSVK